MSLKFSNKPGELFANTDPERQTDGAVSSKQLELLLATDAKKETENLVPLDVTTAIRQLKTQHLDTLETEAIIARALAWLTESPDMLTERLETANQACQNSIHSEQIATLPVLRLLTEIAQLIQDEYLNMDLINALDTNSGFPDEAKHFYSELNARNHEKGNFILHKLIDYAELHQLTLHNQFTTPRFNQHYNQGDYWYGFYDRLAEFAEEEVGKASNYLIQKHFQNFLDIGNLNRIDHEKPDRLEGWVVGATDDATIYTTRNLTRAYTNRIKLGITSGSTGQEPVFELMPGILGKYKNGKLQEVYRNQSFHNQQEIEAKLKARNNKEDEEIFYRSFNKAWYEQSGVLKHSPDQQSWVNGELAQAITNYLKDHLWKTGRFLFIDTSRIDDYDELPLVIKRHIQSVGDEAVEAYFKEENLAKAEPIPKEEWAKILSPIEPLSEEEEYNFRYISSIAVRKRIEDDLSINLANVPAFGQKVFLEYVSKNNIQDFNNLQKTLKSYPNEALRAKIATTFFACAEDEGNAEYILKLANHIESDKALNAVLDKYLSIVNKLTDLERFIRESFPKIEEAPVAEVKKIGRRIQHRANGFLQEMAGKATDTEKMLSNLDSVDADLISLGIVIKELQRKGLLHFKEIQDFELVTKSASEITQEETNNLLELQLITRKTVEEYQPNDLLDSLQEELKGYINSGDNTVFKILYHENKPIGFIHVHKDEQDPNVVWMGGLNMHPSGQNTPLTDAIINEIKQEYFGKYTCKLWVLKDKSDLGKYYNSQGFRLTGQEMIQAGKIFLEMARPKNEPTRVVEAA